MKPPVDVAQTPWELARLLDLVEAHRPQRILEVGVWEGGTLWEWLRIGRAVVAIDDTMRDPGPDVWNGWARDLDCQLELLQGRSDDRNISHRAFELGRYDMVFIDADHTYDSVLSDWTTYRDLLTPSGIVVFHDILPRPGYGVDRLWNEIKNRDGARTVEIVEAGNASANGIGVVWT